MKKLEIRIREFVNQNIGRKLIIMMVPIMCIIMIVTVMLINHVYMIRFLENIEGETQYVTQTFKENMDFCTTDVKSLLNTLSIDDDVKTLVQMNQNNIDYAQLLKCERNLKKVLVSMTSMKSYVQDILVIGENGYQYNYLSYLKERIIDMDWFKKYVDKDKKGFQYIIPHNTDYYETGKGPVGDALSVVLPIKIKSKNEGYVICEIKLDKAAVLPKQPGKDTNMRAYLGSESIDDYYDFSTKKVLSRDNENLSKYIEENTSGFYRNNSDFVVYSKMENSDWYIATVYLYKDIVSSARMVQRIGIIMLIMGCVMILIVAKIISNSMRRPIDDLIHRIQQVEQQNFEPVEIVKVQNQPGEIVLIRNRFEEMIKQINDLIYKVYLDEIYQKNMEYENLVNQLNPHFIYNVLQLIQAKAIMNENYEIDDIVVALSRLMRYTMSNRNKIVTIKEECSYIESYLKLYEQRYSEKFSYEMHVEKELELYPVLKFILQPVVENCIKHGFKNLGREGHIKIDIFQKENRVILLVEDNGNGIEEEKKKTLIKHMEEVEKSDFNSIGLRNTYQRIKLTYGEDADMRIESVENEYTKVYCIIPYEEK